MKKLFFVALSILFVFGLSSCKKEVECECTTSVDGTATGTVTTTLEDDDCSSLESEVTSGGMTSKVECEEK